MYGKIYATQFSICKYPDIVFFLLSFFIFVDLKWRSTAELCVWFFVTYIYTTARLGEYIKGYVSSPGHTQIFSYSTPPYNFFTYIEIAMYHGMVLCGGAGEWCASDARDRNSRLYTRARGRKWTWPILWNLCSMGKINVGHNAKMRIAKSGSSEYTIHIFPLLAPVPALLATKPSEPTERERESELELKVPINVTSSRGNA